jgi:oxygen-dependent protoporphyrinogen oxidase
VNPSTTTQPHIAIIGGGIAGLSAAWYLQQQQIGYTLLEERAITGGLIQTQQVEGLAMEYGPDGFITRKPWALQLVRDLGLEDELITVEDTRERIYILSEGNLVPMPEGLRLLVPTNFSAFLQSPLLSWRGKLRALLDIVIPPRRDDNDESLADFVTRRMGAEMLDKIADPLLAGVYNAEMQHQSILATFPQYRALERKHGSLIRGMRRGQSKRTSPGTATATPALVSLRGGMGQLISELQSRLTGTIRTETPVTAIAADEQGYTLTLGSRGISFHRDDPDEPETLTVDGVIVAAPANIAARLLETIAPQSSAALQQIRYEGIGSMSLAYRKEDVPRALDAYGIVIPGSEGRSIDGMQWSSAKWPQRAPDDTALIRVFFGGPHTRQMLTVEDRLLRRTVRTEIQDLLGIVADPVFTTLHRWHHAYPQYDVGHRERVQKAFDSLPAGVQLAGNSYKGVGIPNTIQTAQEATDALVQVFSKK